MELRARKRWFSLLVILAMLLTLIVPVGTAFAAGNYFKITGGYSCVSDDSEGANAGTIEVVYGDDFDVSAVDYVYAQIELLTDGVTFSEVVSSHLVMMQLIQQ
ncbi:MAG: hypothetical protein ACPLTR_10700 [Thermacetogeniaceae bacterium]